MDDQTIKLILDMGQSGANVTQVKDRLLELEAVANKTAPALDKATGSSGNMGQSLLQTGRIVQDFAQGGLGGILNNIEGFTAALGMGSGLAGLFTVIGVAAALAMPKVKEFFGGISGEAAEAAKKKLEELRKEVESLHEAFLKLKNAPTELEKTAAGEVTKFLSERPHADQAKEALTRSMGGKSTQEALSKAGTRDEWGKLGPEAEMSDETIERRAKSAEFNVSRNSTDPNAGAAAAEQTRRRLQAQRDEAQHKRFGLERSAKDTAAERMLKDAQVAGPAGDRARRELLGRTKDVPGLEGLQDTTEEAIRGHQQRDKAAEARRQAQAHIKQAAEEKNRKELEEAQQRARGQKVLDDEAKAKKKDADDDIKAGVTVAHAGAKKANEAVRSTDIDERAKEYAARMRQQGGDYDQYGRFVPLNARQQDQRLQRRISDETKAAFPQMPFMQRAGVASSIAGEANQQIDQRVLEAQVGAMRAGNDATQATQQAMAGLIQQFQQERARANDLAKRAKGTSDAVQQQQQPAANNGW
jgi:hypothetical protein